MFLDVKDLEDRAKDNDDAAYEAGAEYENGRKIRTGRDKAKALPYFKDALSRGMSNSAHWIKQIEAA